MTLLILGGNPAFNAPADLDFADALQKVKASAHLSLHDDETSRLCTWHLSRAHYLESWGDARTFDGTASIVQPLIEPLFDGRSAIEVLSMLVDEEPQERARDRPRDGQDARQRPAHGIPLEETARRRRDRRHGLEAGRRSGNSAEKIPAEAGLQRAPAKDEYELVFYRDKIHDGRFANNGWLQELPDPMTRLTWDNAAVMSEKTAKTIGVGQDELIELSAGEAKIDAPVFFLPGMAEGVIGMALGYGRMAAGHVGNDVGHDAYKLRTTDRFRLADGQGPAHRPQYRLATVQDHHIVDYVRQEGGPRSACRN